MTLTLADLDRVFAQTPPPASLRWLHQQSVLTTDARRRSMLQRHPGARVLDIGSGLGQTAADLALFPGTDVIGLDPNPEAVAFARTWTDPLDLPVRFVEGDLYEWTPPHRFHAIFSRFVFQHLPDVHGALKRIRNWLEPGGLIVLEDVDDGYSIDYPLFPAPWQRALEAFQALQRQRGGDREIGRKLGVALGKAQFSDPVATVTVQNSTYYLTVEDPSVQWVLQRLNDSLPDLCAANLLTPEQLAEAEDAVQNWLPRWVSQSAGTIVWVATHPVL